VSPLHVAVSVTVLVGTGTVAGVMFSVALSTVPALMAMSPDRCVQAWKLLGMHWDPVMPAIVLSSALGTVLLAVLNPPAARWLFAFAAGLLFTVAAVSHLRNVPINRWVRAVDPDSIPASWADPRPAWRRWHLLRTVLAVAALVVSSLAVCLGAAAAG
jgi:uncharacterized membrane protein